MTGSGSHNQSEIINNYHLVGGAGLSIQNLALGGPVPAIGDGSAVGSQGWLGIDGWWRGKYLAIEPIIEPNLQN